MKATRHSILNRKKLERSFMLTFLLIASSSNVKGTRFEKVEVLNLTTTQIVKRISKNDH